MDREKIEQEPNWQATYRYVVTGKYKCVMRTLTPGFYYWWRCSYDGMFAWGATMRFTREDLEWELANGYLELVAGTPPPVIEPVHDPVRGYWREEWYLTGVVLDEA